MRKEGVWLLNGETRIYFHADGKRDEGRKVTYRRKKFVSGKSNGFENLDKIGHFKTEKQLVSALS